MDGWIEPTSGPPASKSGTLQIFASVVVVIVVVVVVVVVMIGRASRRPTSPNAS
jgi:hypothetical protein